MVVAGGHSDGQARAANSGINHHAESSPGREVAIAVQQREGAATHILWTNCVRNVHDCRSESMPSITAFMAPTYVSTNPKSVKIATIFLIRRVRSVSKVSTPIVTQPRGCRSKFAQSVRESPLMTTIEKQRSGLCTCADINWKSWKKPHWRLTHCAVRTAAAVCIRNQNHVIAQHFSAIVIALCIAPPSRALEYKTQVFVNDAGDYFRTRLTHTLEVAQIGRTLARSLGANEDLVEAICLAHDLGHPPFGHAGEDILNQLVSDSGGFNHNHQSYRVVTKLERRYPKWNGLNLTMETLEGIAKHETEYDVSAIIGIAPETGPSLEAQIANIADELAYNAHDLDDGLHAGLIRVEQLAALELWQEVIRRSNWSGRFLDDVSRHNLIRELVGLQVDDVLQHSASQIELVAPEDSVQVQLHPQPLVAHSTRQKSEK